MTELLNSIPPQYHWLVVLIVMLIPHLTRGLYAWVNRGDARSIIAAVFFGTNTPRPKPDPAPKPPTIGTPPTHP